LNAVNDLPVSDLLASDPLAPDLERRFGGLRRLYGEAGYQRLRALRVAVVGLGGVGSWTAEALARSGIASLVLIDMDHVSESNINRQVQATGATLGKAKGEALRERIADIHPGCDVQLVDDFVTADNWPALLTVPVDAVIDACDQVQAKLALAQWAIATGTPLVMAGAAGGKRRPQAVEVDDLANVTHDPLLASLRQRLRKQHGAPRSGAIGVRCVFSREAVVMPVMVPAADGDACDTDANRSDGSLNCHGYGSSVVVTATFGLVLASEALEIGLQSRLR
jgi:tRNA A37 threonylcarbamoyladenosine dehydratase